MTSYLAVGIGGFLGAVARFLFNQWIPEFGFPFATLLVNQVGSFGLAFIVTWLALRTVPESFKLAITTGFFGAFTTFSTFSVELFDLLAQGELLVAIIYVVASLGLGIFFAWLAIETMTKGKY